MSSIAILVISLAVILAGAEIFVNGIEWLGQKLNLPESAVGSVLAAVGTALPETIIPLIAILFSTGQESDDIGIGAILGAPLMLATVAMFVTGMAVVLFSRKRVNRLKVTANYSTMKRDLGLFIIVYAIAVLTGIIPPELRILQLIIAGLLALSYVWYVYQTIREEHNLEEERHLPKFYLAPKSSDPALGLILFQVTAALVLIVVGAHLFVAVVEEIALMYAVPAFILALIIAPLATELPEKFNSIIWVSRDKDTLALGNITGAMVFQSSIIPAIGISLTDWQLSSGALIAAGLALLSAAVIYIEISRKRHITAPILLMGGVFYAVFIIGVVKGVISW